MRNFTNLSDERLYSLLFDPEEVVTSKGTWRKDGTGDLAELPANPVLDLLKKQMEEDR